MKTLTRKTIVLVALSMLATVFAQAQTSQPAAPVPPTVPAPAPVQAVSQELDSLIGSLSFRSQAGSGNTVLVIPSEQTTTEDLLTINEDMNVMSRIFEKNLEQERVTTLTSNIFLPGRRNAYGMLLGSSRGQIQSMYLQGFGALFLLKVDFPLSPPPDVQEQEQETQKAEQGDPVWQEMRQQMYEPEKVDRRRRTDRPESKYDAEKVENLKTTLIKALKHAVNIRSLKPGIGDSDGGRKGRIYRKNNRSRKDDSRRKPDSHSRKRCLRYQNTKGSAGRFAGCIRRHGIILACSSCYSHEKVGYR